MKLIQGKKWFYLNWGVKKYIWKIRHSQNKKQKGLGKEIFQTL